VLAGLLQDPGTVRQWGGLAANVSAPTFVWSRWGTDGWLLQEAVRLHTAQPRPVPGLGLGRACATQVVEHSACGGDRLAVAGT